MYWKFETYGKTCRNFSFRLLTFIMDKYEERLRQQYALGQYMVNRMQTATKTGHPHLPVPISKLFWCHYSIKKNTFTTEVKIEDFEAVRSIVFNWFKEAASKIRRKFANFWPVPVLIWPPKKDPQKNQNFFAPYSISASKTLLKKKNAREILKKIN